MTILSRANEMTAVLNRHKFDQVPGGVTDSADIARWQQYRANYHEARQLREFEFPLQIDFELNSTCNMRCQHCSHSQGAVEKRDLPFAAFKKVIDEGQRHGLCSIKLNYINEPLLKPDLARYIEYAKANGVLNVYLATNGVLLTRAVGQQLIESGLSKLMVSIDAITAQTFLTMRNSRQFDRIVENVRAFLDLRDSLGVDYPLARVNFLRTKDNAHEAERFIDYWAGIADMIGFQDEVGLPGIDGDLLPSSKSEFRCSFPFKLVTVDSAGSILPCCTFSGREMSLGNVDAMTIHEAWNSQQARQLRQMHANGGYRSNPICRHCVEGGNQ